MVRWCVACGLWLNLILSWHINLGMRNPWCHSPKHLLDYRANPLRNFHPRGFTPPKKIGVQKTVSSHFFNNPNPPNFGMGWYFCYLTRWPKVAFSFYLKKSTKNRKSQKPHFSISLLNTRTTPLFAEIPPVIKIKGQAPKRSKHRKIYNILRIERDMCIILKS